MHFNIRSLKYKVFEIKKIVKEQSPNIIGLSETELKKGQHFEIKSLKIPGYNLLLPKSWESDGFARVAVFVKKTFSYIQLHELEDDLVQSIWLEGASKTRNRFTFAMITENIRVVLENQSVIKKSTLIDFCHNGKQPQLMVTHQNPMKCIFVAI